MGDVQEFIAVERAHRNPRKHSWLTTNMIVAYALSIVEEAISSTYREAGVQDVEGCHGGRDEFFVQERHLKTDRDAQGKEVNWL